MKVVQAYLPASAQTGKSLTKKKGIVIHWVANPNSKAISNINYWKRLSSGVQAHDVIDLDGTVYNAVPYNVMCYHVGSKVYTKDALAKLSTYPNNCTVGIECTHIDWTGKMTDATYATLVEHTADLCKKFDLTEKDLWLHWSVVGWKDCHRWFVNNKAEWTKFVNKVANILHGGAAKVVNPPTVNYDDLVIVDNLGKGDKGPAVKELQTLLNKLGYSVGAVDGSFGPKTDAAVEKFQKGKGLVPDGIVGDKTQDALEKALDALEKKSNTWYRVRRNPSDATSQLAAFRDKESALDLAKKEGAYVLENTKVIHEPFRIGEVTGDVWLHSTPDFTAASRVRVLKQGERYKVYGEKNGMYNVGGTYVSKKYIKIV